MKKLTIFIILVLGATLVSAQEKDEVQTLISGEMESGGFGGPVVKFGEFMDGDFGVMVGGRGGWIINHAFTIGGGGYGLANDIQVDSSRYLNFGYGGVELGYIVASRKLIHFSFSTLIGAGGVGYRSSISDDDFNEDTNGKSVFVIEPTLNIMLNVTNYFRIGLGASYRYIDGLEPNTLSNGDISGPSATLSFKFGSF